MSNYANYPIAFFRKIMTMKDVVSAVIKIKMISVVAVSWAAMILLTGCNEHVVDAIRIEDDVKSAAEGQSIQYNSFETLNIPTQIVNEGGVYFIVDCYHDQIIWNEDCTVPIKEWKIMSSGINRGHTVASDGTVYLVDNTDSNQILVYEKYEDKYVLTQYLDGIGFRPHYIIYDEETDSFYAWSSFTGEMYIVKRSKKEEDNNLVYVSRIMKIDELNEVYIRSFTIDDDRIYFVSGVNGKITVADKKTFNVIEEYTVQDRIAGMVQIMPVEDSFLITVSTDIEGNQDYATIIQTDSLEALSKGQYKDVYDNFVGKGTPYYISQINGSYYLTEHRNGYAIWKFDFIDGEITNVENLY